MKDLQTSQRRKEKVFCPLKDKAEFKEIFHYSKPWINV